MKCLSAASSQVQCYAIISSKIHVIRQFQNDISDGASLMAEGRLFQARAATKRNARNYLGGI